MNRPTRLLFVDHELTGGGAGVVVTRRNGGRGEKGEFKVRGGRGPCDGDGEAFMAEDIQEADLFLPFSLFPFAVNLPRFSYFSIPIDLFPLSFIDNLFRLYIISVAVYSYLVYFKLYFYFPLFLCRVS